MSTKILPLAVLDKCIGSNIWILMKSILFNKKKANDNSRESSRDSMTFSTWFLKMSPKPGYRKTDKNKSDRWTRFC